MKNKLKINHIHISANTSDGKFGVDLPFNTGLNIIHADNTHGKSTVIHALLYALGLEGTLGPSRKSPLKAALSRAVRNSNGVEIPVLNSEVYLELENSNQKKIVIKRSHTKNENNASILITVWEDMSFSNELHTKPYNDYFIRDSGAYQREMGFHNFLCKFLNLKLPTVQKYDGSETLLYLEAIFTVLYVEQTRGWGGIQNITPTYLGIKDIQQKVIEYILNLDILEIRSRRASLLSKSTDIEKMWSLTLDKIDNLASNISGFCNDLPEKPSDNILDSHLGIITIYDNNEEVTLEKIIENNRAKLELLKSSVNNPPENEIDQYSGMLEELQVKLNDHEFAVNTLIDDLGLSKNYFTSLHKTLSSNKDYLRKYRDVEKIKEIGSQKEFNFSSNNCPTCFQAVEDSLLPHIHDHQTLGVTDNIKYLEKQIETIKSLILSETKTIKRKEKQINEINEKTRSFRKQIRQLKKSLSSSSNINLDEYIREQAKLEELIDKYESSNDKLEEFRMFLVQLGHDNKDIQSKLKVIRFDNFSRNDLEKLNYLEEVFKLYLDEFGYTSTPIDSFSISKRTYKPSIDDIELGSEASASDNIRMIWAYLYALCSAASEFEDSTNHLKLLIMDEPRQQEAKELSFKAFIKRAAESKLNDQQIIIGTSEKFEDLKNMLEGIDVKLHHFDSDIIAKFPD